MKAAQAEWRQISWEIRQCTLLAPTAGVVLEQFRDYAPDVLASFQDLAQTGCVEFLAETYYHSLSFLFARDKFAEQVRMHQQLMQQAAANRAVARQWAR